MKRTKLHKVSTTSQLAAIHKTLKSPQERKAAREEQFQKALNELLNL